MRDSGQPDKAIPPWDENLIIMPWDKKRLRMDSRLEWSILFLQGKTPQFVYEKPPEKTIERVYLITKHLCANKWVVCFGNNTIYMDKLFHYVVAAFVLTTKNKAEITTPKKLIEYAFNISGDEIQFTSIPPPFEHCRLLVIPYFDPMYPGYQKARPKIEMLLHKKKMNDAPCLFGIYVPHHLPADLKSAEKHMGVLSDIIGKSAGSLFGKEETVFVAVKAPCNNK